MKSLFKRMTYSSTRDCIIRLALFVERNIRASCCCLLANHVARLELYFFEDLEMRDRMWGGGCRLRELDYSADA